MTIRKGFDGLTDQDRRARRSANGGNVATVRRLRKQTPAEAWAEALPGVIERFLADMAERASDESETPHPSNDPRTA